MIRFKRFAIIFFTTIAVLFAVSCAGLFDEVGIITVPLDQQEVSGLITIQITPPEDVLVDYVKITIQSNFFIEITAEPYQYEWDTRDETNGKYYIFAELFGQDGDYITNGIHVYVRND